MTPSYPSSWPHFLRFWRWIIHSCPGVKRLNSRNSHMKSAHKVFRLLSASRLWWSLEERLQNGATRNPDSRDHCRAQFVSWITGVHSTHPPRTTLKGSIVILPRLSYFGGKLFSFLPSFFLVYFQITNLYVQVRLRIYQMSQGNRGRLQTCHEKLWAQERIDMRNRLYITNDIRSFNVVDPDNVVMFHGVSVHCLFNVRSLNTFALVGLRRVFPT